MTREGHNEYHLTGYIFLPFTPGLMPSLNVYDYSNFLLAVTFSTEIKAGLDREIVIIESVQAVQAISGLNRLDRYL